jgi:hypothetical protein
MSLWCLGLTHFHAGSVAGRLLIVIRSGMRARATR